MIWVTPYGGKDAFSGLNAVKAHGSGLPLSEGWQPASGKLVDDFGSWSWTGLAPDGSILALRDISTQEIYALDVKFP